MRIDAQIVASDLLLELSLIPNVPPKGPIPVRFSYKGPSTLGWWAVVDGAWSNRTRGRADQNVRFVQSLAWHIVEHEAEISAYAK
jgi:hypothetical protein